MASRKRFVSATGYYHVMSRGNNKAKIFTRERDYKKILQYVKRIVDDNLLQVYAYCIMPNHYHLLVRVPQETGCQSTETAKDREMNGCPVAFDITTATANHLSVDGLSKAMHRINTAYSHYYMASHEHTGHVFQGAFRSREIHNEAYLKNVLRYIHLNPVKANYTRHASEYRWSSYWEYIGKAIRNIIHGDGKDLLNRYGFNGVLNFKSFHDSMASSDLQEMYLDLEDKEDIIAEELDRANALIAQAKAEYLELAFGEAIPDNLKLSEPEKLSDTIKDPKVRMELATQILNGTSILSCRSIARLTNVDRNRLKRNPKKMPQIER